MPTEFTLWVIHCACYWGIVAVVGNNLLVVTVVCLRSYDVMQGGQMS
jgi:hypothetical protein